MNISEIMKSAPRYLTLRYGSLNSYVWESLFPQDYRNRIFSRIKSEPERKGKFIKMKSLADEASLLVFIFVTRKIFQEGATAAKDTVDILKELDVEEFYLGSAKFSGRNENVILGDLLAEELLNLLDDEMKTFLLEAHYVSNIIDRYQVIKKDI